MIKVTRLGESIKKNTPQKTVFEVRVRIGRRIVRKVSKEIDKRNNLLIHYPFFVDERQGLIKPKSETIKKLIFEQQKILKGFFTVETKGYGFTKPNKYIQSFIEDTFPSINTVRLSNTDSRISGNELILNHHDFINLQTSLKHNFNMYDKTNDNTLKAFFNQYLGQNFVLDTNTYNGGELFTFLQNKTNIHLSDDDRNAIIKLFDNLDIVSYETIIETRKVIEKKQLESIIEEFQRLLGGDHSEGVWQRFFSDNPRIFSQIFSFSATIFREQAYVGGKTVDNTNGNVVDFLYRNKLSNNVSIIEIKKASTKIFKDNAYRGDDVFSLSYELSGAINQIITQKHSLIMEANTLIMNENNEENKFKVFNPKCFIIIGKLGELSNSQKKCFELFRNTHKDIEILTFDEVYDKMLALLSIFNTGDDANNE